MKLRDTYPHWIYDGSLIPDPLGYGERAVNFLRHLKHPKSRHPDLAFELDPWVERIVRAIYGPRHLVDDPVNQIRRGDRIVKMAFIMIPRGGHKSGLGAALALLHLIGPEKTPASEIIAAASDKKQASIVFENAANMIRLDNRLGRLVHMMDYKKTAIHRANRSKFEAISSDGGTQHGRTPSLVICDELHAWKDHSGLWEAMKTGLVKVRNSLCVVITTAGRGENNIAFSLYDTACKVATSKIIKPSFLPVLFEAPRNCDWRDEDLWFAVNPGLKYGYPVLPDLRESASNAEFRPSERESFKQFNLNVWLQNYNDPFIDLDVYDKGAINPKDMPAVLERLKGKPCWIAVDMSLKNDLSAVIAAFRDDDGGYTVLPFLFCPKDTLQEKQKADGVPYPLWAEQGHIHPTPGPIVDYNAVADCIKHLSEIYKVKEVAIDQAHGKEIEDSLRKAGIFAFLMSSPAKIQSPGIVTLERAIAAGLFRHTGNPVLRWNFENVPIYTGPTGLKSMNKGKAKDRIDGAVACWMAVSRAAAPKRTSIYDNPAYASVLRT